MDWVYALGLAANDGEFACLDITSSRQGSCQNTPGGGGGHSVVKVHMHRNF